MDKSDLLTEIDESLSISCRTVKELELCGSLLLEHNFRVLTLNIRSLQKNFLSLQASLCRLEFQPDVIVLTECWLNENSVIFQLPGYKSYQTTKIINKSGGVTIYVRDLWTASFSEPEFDDANCLQIKLQNKVTLLGIYRSPSFANTERFLDSLDDILNKLKSESSVIVTGDINIDLLNDSPNAAHAAYQCLLAEHGLLPAITHPTRGKACLDHGYIKLKGNTAQGIVCEASVTDHHIVLLGINYSTSETENKNRFKLKTNYNMVIEELSQLDWVHVTSNANIDEAVILYNKTLTDIINKHTSRIKISRSKFTLKSWITPGLLRCIRHRDNLHAQVKQQPKNNVLKIIYSRYRNYCNAILRQRKADHDTKELEKNSNDPKKLWRTIKEICQVPKRTCSNQELLTYNANKNVSIDKCNEFFVSVGQNLATNILKKKQSTEDEKYIVVKSKIPPNNSLFLSPTDKQEISDIIDNFKDDSAPGLDEMGPQLLKRIKNCILEPLNYICNLSMETGIVPACWKTAVITPIHKSGAKNVPDNFRPISLLCVTSKILEKLVNNRLVSFIEKNSVLSDRQFGFRREKSTEQAVSLLTGIIASNIDNGQRTVGVFLDLAKAFDTVSIPILLGKLETFGVRGLPLDWFRSYLSGRYQRVKIGNIVSGSLPVAFGVPQGSILGPTLFLMYMDNILRLNIAQSEVICYADDTAIIFHGATWEETINIAEKGMSIITAWLEQNLLTLNLKKTNLLTFHINKSSRPNIKSLKVHNAKCSLSAVASGSIGDCDCNAIDRVDTTKYLGIIIDENLNFKAHIRTLAKKTRKFIYIAKILRASAPKNIGIQVYISLCQSVLQYCVSVWGSADKSCMLELERAQRAVLKVLLGKPRRFSTEELYREARVLRVRQLYILWSLLKLIKVNIRRSSCSKRGRKIAERILLPKTKTLFAARLSSYVPIKVFNAIGKVFSIPNNYYEAKTKLKEWLLDRTYEETEGFLYNPC